MSTPESDVHETGDASAPPAASGGDRTDRGLKRIVIALAVVTALVFVTFAVVYYLGQRSDSGLTLNQRAIAAAEQAVRENPNDVRARLALASAYSDEGRTEEALSQYDEIISAQEDNRTALLASAAILYQLEDLPGARARYEKVVEVSGGEEFSAADPQLQEAHYFLGAIDLTMGDTAAATTNLKAALDIDRTDADAWYLLGNTQMRDDDYADAVESYDQALAFVPTGWCDPYNGLEIAYGNLNKPDGVKFAKAMGLICNGDADAGVPDLTGLTKGEFALPALLGLGQAAEKASDVPAAIEWYRQARALDPANIAALTALARLGADGSAQPSPIPEPSASNP